MLMGALANNTASVRADVTVGGQPPANLLFAFEDPLDPVFAAIGVPGVAAVLGAQTLTLTSNSVRGTTDATDMYVASGIDVNGDGRLQLSEIRNMFPYDVKVVSTATRANALSTLASRAFWGAAVYPVASNWLYAFLTDQGLNEATNTPGTLSTNDPTYNSHVGALFTGQAAPVNVGTFGPNSTVASEIAMSAEMNQLVESQFDAARLQNLAQQLSGNSGAWSNFSITIPTNGIEFNTGDLYYSIHDAALPSLTINFSAAFNGGILHVIPTVVGQLTDIYDFDFDRGGLIHLGALAEAGYAGPGMAGHVFKEIINLNNVMETMLFTIPGS